MEGINQASSDVKAYNNGGEQRDDKLPRFVQQFVMCFGDKTIQLINSSLPPFKPVTTFLTLYSPGATPALF